MIDKDGNDIFKLNIYYDSTGLNFGGQTVQRNGNISQLVWQIRGRERQGYTLQYDYLDRLTTSYYADINVSGTATTDNKYQENINYADARGNISAITRNGLYKTTGAATCWTLGQIDNLTYTYPSGTNRLQKIADSAPTGGSGSPQRNSGFNPGAASGTATYVYDVNGNMTTDPYKNMTVEYNHLNLPKHFQWLVDPLADTYQHIYITYDHSGKKLRKQVVNTSAATVYTQDYVDGLEYRTNGGGALTLEAIYHAEGRITPLSGSNYQYEYTIKDHLGNARVSFADLNANSLVDVPGDILQENHYYPFGMNMSYGWMNNAGLVDDRHQYNVKELNDDFGLNLSDYGARWYDASVGRWWSVDPLGEELEQIDESPYVAFWNNPIVYDDPEGQCPNCATAGIGAVVGGLIGGGIELGRQLWDDGKVTSWSAVGGSALQGAITGAAAGFTGGASLLATAAVTGTANAVGGAVNRSIQGQSTTVKNVVTDATVGAVLGAGGKIVGNVVENATNKLSNAAKGKLGETVTEVKYAAKGYVKKGNALVDTGRKTSTGRDQIAKYDHKMENVITGKQLYPAESGLQKTPIIRQYES